MKATWAKHKGLFLFSLAWMVLVVGVLLWISSEEGRQTDLVQINKGLISDANERTHLNRPIFIRTEEKVDQILERLERLEKK